MSHLAHYDDKNEGLNSDTNQAISPYDLLQSMSECIIETRNIFVIPKIPDRATSTSQFVPRKPPREIFYRQNLLFAINEAKELKTIYCNCLIKCGMNNIKGIAVRKCLSCASYGTFGEGYFCFSCFDYSHPWHRVEHIHIAVAKDETINYVMQIGKKNLVSERQGEEGKILLKMVLNSRSELNHIIEDEEGIEKKMSQYGSKIVHLESTIKRLQQSLQQDIENTSHENEKYLHENKVRDLEIQETKNRKLIVKIQRVYRGFKARKIISFYYLERTVRVWDAESGRDFYYDKINGSSSWETPYLLLRSDHDKLEYKEESKRSASLWCLKNNCPRRTIYKIRKKKDAAIIIKNFFLCIKSRRIILSIALDTFRRVFDNDYNVHFYWNSMTQRSVWNKPKVFLSSEPPMQGEEIENSKKRNPKTIRETIKF